MIGKNGEIGRIETRSGAPANTSLDWPRIRHLLKLGVIASLTVLASDMLLGWGVSDPSVAELPATILFLAFFLLSIIVQMRAFLRGHTPLPRRCWVFSLLFGLVFAVLMRLCGDHALTNALSTGWISVGNLWMTGGLLFTSKKVSE